MRTETSSWSARGPGYEVSIGETGASIRLPSVELRFALVGARATKLQPAGALPGVSNYFVGAPETWRSGVSGYGRLVQSQVLPGVDMVYYGSSQGELEYDLVLGAGVAANQLEVSLRGAESLELADNGDLLLRLPGGVELRKHAPVAYQLHGQGRTLVPAHYELHGKNLGFVVGEHDESLPLIIDPVLAYSSFLGAQNYDELLAATSDRDGNTYMAGHTNGSLFPAVNPAQPTYAGGAGDAVVCKLNPEGNAFVYCTYWGGTNTDQAYAVATDNAGNTYVTGVTYSTNFPTVSAFKSTPSGGGLAEGFLTKFNQNGVVLYSTYLGGSGDDFPRGIAVTSTGSPVIVGATFSSDFPLKNPLDGSLGGGVDAFVTSLTPAGNALAFSTFLGGSLDEYGNAVAISKTDEIVVVGSTNSTNFPTLGAYQAAFGGGAHDAFVTRYSAGGTALAYSSYLGGNFSDDAFAVALTTDGPVIGGSTTSTNFPTKAAQQLSLASTGVTDGFLTRLGTGGSSLLVSTYVGGSAADVVRGVTVDSAGNAYITGDTASNDLALFQGQPGQLAYHGAGDAFVAGYSPLGVAAFSGYLGGTGADQAAAIAVSANGLVHVVGGTQSNDFPLVSATQAAFGGAQDGFILRFPAIPSRGAGVPAAPHVFVLLFGALCLALGLQKLAQKLA